MNIVQMEICKLKPYENNPRIITDEAIAATAASIDAFGFRQPIVIDKSGVVIAGHTRLEAAKRLGLLTVPCEVADDLTEDEANAYRLADNSTGEMTSWDFQKRDFEMHKLEMFDFESFGIIQHQNVEMQDALDLDDDGGDCKKNKSDEVIACHCPKCGFVFEVKT